MTIFGLFTRPSTLVTNDYQKIITELKSAANGN
jgi:hypothetical protein